MQIKRKHVVTGGWMAICLTCVGGFEGERLNTYRDPVGIPTYCFGETRDAKMGKSYTDTECRMMLGNRLEEFAKPIEACVKVPISPARKAALVSAAYNLGAETVCRSEIVRGINAGDPHACNHFMDFTHAHRRGVLITLPGLVKRRASEKELCEQ